MRKRINRKIVLGMGALLCCIGIVALCSFFPFIIDPSGWQTSEWVSDQLIIAAISIFSIVCVMGIGQAFNAQDPNSSIAKARARFINDTMPKVTGRIGAFEQWVRKTLQPSDLRQAKERRLISAGLTEMSLLELEDEEIKSLIGKPQKIGQRYYKGITKKQAKEVLKAKEMRIRAVSPTYYLTIGKKDVEKTITERSGEETKKKGVLLSFSIVSKVVMSIVISMIFASLVLDTATSPDAAKSWMKFLSRLFAMASSAFMGWTIGTQNNDIDAEYISMKSMVHERFDEDKEFVAKSEQEEAKEEFAKRVLEETQGKPALIEKRH